MVGWLAHLRKPSNHAAPYAKDHDAATVDILDITIEIRGHHVIKAFIH